ncbi:MAG: AAA family ATPase [Bacteroidaceae bacterium]|nr:AAA family ATPase [Bacteroidaceae bacterium]
MQKLVNDPARAASFRDQIKFFEAQDKRVIENIKAANRRQKAEERKYIERLKAMTMRKDSPIKEANLPVPAPAVSYKAIVDADIKPTPEQQAALDVLMSGENVFLTGKAGTGKSYVTRQFVEQSERKGKNILVCAPTGIAARNVDGYTLHRTFGIPTAILDTDQVCESDYCCKLIDKADIILIDEISMCRADTFGFVVRSILSSIRKTERKKQLVVVGDFYQLRPVIKEADKSVYRRLYGNSIFAFESSYWRQINFTTIELSEVIRQRDHSLATALNNIRRGAPDYSLFRRYACDDPDAITVCATNAEVSRINRSRLSELSNVRSYRADEWGDTLDDYPTDNILELAVGAHVIMVANDPDGRWVNGTLGIVTATGETTISVRMQDGHEYQVEPYTWNAKQCYVRTSRRTGKDVVMTEIVGGFSQLPVKLAYAITIHRSQGQTYDKINIHPDRIFEEGQLYVALSRCRTLEGIRIVGELSEKSLKINEKVKNFYTTISKDTIKKGGMEKEDKRKTFTKVRGEEVRENIKRLLKRFPMLTLDDLSEHLEIRRSAVQKHIDRMKAEGTLVRTGATKNGRWWVV